MSVKYKNEADVVEILLRGGYVSAGLLNSSEYWVHSCGSCSESWKLRRTVADALFNGRKLMMVDRGVWTLAPWVWDTAASPRRPGVADDYEQEGV